MIRFVSLKALCSTITSDSGKAETKSKNPDLIIRQCAVRIFYFGYTISLTKSLCLVQIVSFESLLSKSVSVSECLPILLFPLSIGVCISSRKRKAAGLKRSAAFNLETETFRAFGEGSGSQRDPLQNGSRTAGFGQKAPFPPCAGAAPSDRCNSRLSHKGCRAPSAAPWRPWT